MSRPSGHSRTTAPTRRNPDAPLDRYRRPGFAVHAYGGPGRYGFAERGSVELRLNEWSEHDPDSTGAVVCIYVIYVSDADAVSAERKASGVEGRFVEPADTPYKPREFGYADTDGTAHRVGSPLAA